MAGFRQRFLQKEPRGVDGFWTYSIQKTAGFRDNISVWRGTRRESKIASKLGRNDGGFVDRNGG